MAIAPCAGAPMTANHEISAPLTRWWASAAALAERAFLIEDSELATASQIRQQALGER